jgi:hypothetical protein
MYQLIRQRKQPKAQQTQSTTDQEATSPSAPHLKRLVAQLPLLKCSSVSRQLLPCCCRLLHLLLLLLLQLAKALQQLLLTAAEVALQQ